MAHNLHTIILAGGSGSRFWPLSRELSPKQMLRIFDEESLLVKTIERALEVTSENGRIWIVVGEALLDEVRNHIKAHESLADAPIEYVVEPCARNTAPALALAAAFVRAVDPEATVLMMPSDHICESGQRWKEVVRAGEIRARAGDLVTIGLRPTRPETGYGYIEVGEELLAAQDGKFTAVNKAIRFVEKPDAATAEELVADGHYLWNSGMLIATVRTIIKQMRMASAVHGSNPDTMQAGQMATVGETFADMGPDCWRQPVSLYLYSALPSVPFDKAVLEVSEVVSVIPTDLKWSDVGSLTTLEELAEPDDAGNRFIGNTIDLDSCDTLVYSPESAATGSRLIATLGLKDVMIVDTADATLVADRSRAQDVRKIVDALKEQGAPEIAQSKTSLRPWGSWTMLVRAQGFHVKQVEVLPGSRLSLQSHKQRAEHWIVLEGLATVTRGDEVSEVGSGESIFIPKGTVHRLENATTEPLRIVEVATGDYLGEDDITRIDDDFGR